jgi:uncharacterized protein (DUF2384 family)
MITLFVLASEVLGSNWRALKWLVSKNRALGRRPIMLAWLDPRGCQQVMDVLDRIEDGTFS